MKLRSQPITHGLYFNSQIVALENHVLQGKKQLSPADTGKQTAGPLAHAQTMSFLVGFAQSASCTCLYPCFG